MAKLKTIESRLGSREIDTTKILNFPKGLIGFEKLREFIILEVRENSPFVILQSLEDSNIGLLTADPFSFITDYTVHIGNFEQQVLKVNNPSELAVLVTAAIPAGKPEDTTLNLTGPILINHSEKIGLQIPQADNKAGAYKINLKQPE